MIIQNHLNLKLAIPRLLYAIYALINAVFIAFTQWLPLTTEIKLFASLALAVLTIISAIKISRDNSCRLVFNEGVWFAEYSGVRQPLSALKLRFFSAYWISLSIKQENAWFYRTLYFSPLWIPEKDFRWLCRYFSLSY